MSEQSFWSDPTPISENHPLQQLFYHLVAYTFQDILGLQQKAISHYLANMLTEFTHTDNLYRVRDARGVRLTEVAAMLMEADPAGNAASFDQERAVHKHIGDFTLFWAGVYPEMLQRLRRQGRADHLIDYVRQGKQSYYIVSTFQHGRYAEDAALFRQLSEEFELCLYGLNLVRRDWEQIAATHQHSPSES
jgi:hypothetical protein